MLDFRLKEKELTVKFEQKIKQISQNKNTFESRRGDFVFFFSEVHVLLRAVGVRSFEL